VSNIEKIPTPQEMFAERLEELRRTGSSVSARNVAERLGLTLGKDVINGIFNGDLNRRRDSYPILARALQIDEFEVEAALAWHSLREEGRAALRRMIREVDATRGQSRDRLENCLRWMAPQTVVLPGPPGSTRVSNGELHFLFVYADELSPGQVRELARSPDQRDLLERTRIVFLVIPADWSDDQSQPYRDLVTAFSTFVRADSIQIAQEDNSKRIVCGTDQVLLDWIFRHRFEPSAYVETRLRKIDRGDLYTQPLAPLRVSLNKAEPKSAEAVLLAWCRNASDEVNVLSLEGAYGTGKTTLLEGLELKLLSTTPTADANLEHIPVRISARGWIAGGEAKLYEWLCEQVFAAGSFGKVAFDTGMPPDVFAALCLGRSRFILLVDGLDEVVRASETLRAAMEALRWFASLGNRVVIATRPEVFIDEAELDRQLLQPGVDRALILPIEAKEVHNYIENFLVGDERGLALVHALRAREEAGETLERPLFLNYICSLAQENPNRLERITANEPYDLFELLTDEWLQRERFSTPLFKEKGRIAVQEFLQEMAIELSARQDGLVADDQMTIAVQTSLEDVTRVLCGEGQEELDEETIREARVCSFVTVEDNDGLLHYRFNLRPFESFFLAEAIRAELSRLEWEPQDSKIGRMRLDPTAIKFAASGLRNLPLESVKSRLHEAIAFTGSSKAGRLWPFTYLGGNAASLYAEINGKVLDLDLSGVSLAGMDLREATLSGEWRAVDLSEATISGCDLSALRGTNVYAVGAYISGTSDGWPRLLDVPVPGGLIQLPGGEISCPWDELPAPKGFTFIPPGQFTFGAVPSPLGDAVMHGFYLKQTSVTNGEFRSFLSPRPEWEGEEALAKIQEDLRPLGAELGSELHYLFGFEGAPRDLPVVYLPRTVMIAYCDAVGSRLPSEAEWEHAFVTGQAESGEVQGVHHAALISVGNLPRFGNGVAGMWAHTREMCADCYWPLEQGLRLLPTFRQRISPYFRPARVHPKSPRGIIAVSPAKGVLRGTSFADHDEDARKSREPYPLGNMDKDVSFRPVIDLAPGLALAAGLPAKVAVSEGPTPDPRPAATGSKGRVRAKSSQRPEISENGPDPVREEFPK
jgi:Sulfatase-modifying factor enzyme 1/NACHT domain